MEQFLEIGKVLKWIRKTKRISQVELAKQLNLSKSTIYHFEHDGNISLNNYLKYCKCLQIDAYLPLLICGNENCAKLFKQLMKVNLDSEAYAMLMERILIEGTLKETELLVKMLSDK